LSTYPAAPALIESSSASSPVKAVNIKQATSGMVASGIRCKKGRARFRFVVMLGDSSDILRAVVVLGGGCGARPELAGRVEQRAAQVLQ